MKVLYRPVRQVLDGKIVGKDGRRRIDRASQLQPVAEKKGRSHQAGDDDRKRALSRCVAGRSRMRVDASEKSAEHEKWQSNEARVFCPHGQTAKKSEPTIIQSTFRIQPDPT